MWKEELPNHLHIMHLLFMYFCPNFEVMGWLQFHELLLSGNFYSAALALVWWQGGETTQKQTVLHPTAALHDPGHTARPGHLS